MPQLSRDGAMINYEVWGEDGAWVTLVNGHNRPLNDFRLMGRHLSERGFRVLALDNRGAGRSETYREFTLADMVDDVAALWDEEGVARTHLLGISMGGFIAATLALDHAARVRRLVLVSTAAGQAYIRRDDTPWSSDPAEVEAKLRPYFTADFAARNEMLVRSMAKQIAKSVEDGGFAEKSAAQRRALAGFDLTARLGGLKAPTLVIHGAEDRIIPLAAGRELAQLIKGAQLEVLPGAGHLLLAERPKELYALVTAFFQGA